MSVKQVSVAEALELAAEGRRVIDVREPVGMGGGAYPDATLLPLAELPSRIGELVPDPATPLLVHCALRSPLRPCRRASRGARLLRHREHGRPYRRLASAGRCLGGSAAAAQRRAAAALQPPGADPRDRPGRAAQAARRQGPADRRRRARLAGRALPRRVGGRHHWPRRRRRGRRVEPPAPDPARGGSRGHAEDGVRAPDAELRSTPKRGWWSIASGFPPTTSSA